MKLLIVQQGLGLHYGLSHTFPHSPLRDFDCNQLNRLFRLPGNDDTACLYLPVDHLDKEKCHAQRFAIQDIFTGDAWNDLRIVQDERYSDLKHQHREVLPYLPFHNDNEVAGLFPNYKPNTVKSYRRDSYHTLNVQNAGELAQYLFGINIAPAINPRFFSLVIRRPLF